MQINRLFEIIYLLMNHGTMTAKQLAEHFEVSSRTIYRDIDTLSGAGIPIYACQGKGGGIRLLSDYILNKSLLSEQEQNEILFALESLHATNGSQNDQTLSRIRLLFQKQNIDWIDIDFSHWSSSKKEREKFELLKAGILEHRLVSFVYFNAKGESKQRWVEPYKLYFKSGSWYLQGFCQMKKEFRLFKIFRMHQVVLLKDIFLPVDTIPPYDMGESTDTITLELLFCPQIAFRVYDEFDHEDIQKNSDGSLSVCVTYPQGTWVYGYLLSFGEYLIVKEPQQVQEVLKQQAKKILQNYQQDF